MIAKVGILNLLRQWWYLFHIVNVHWPGSVHDAQVFANSALLAEVTSERILQGDTRKICGFDIPALLTADSAYPCHLGF